MNTRNGSRCACVAVIVVCAACVMVPEARAVITDRTGLGGQGAVDPFGSIGTVLRPSANSVPIPPSFTEQLPSTNTVMPPLTPNQASQGYVTFSVNPLNKVYPSTAPRAEQIGTTLDLSSAQGEFEPVTFSIRALQELNVTASLRGELVGPGGATIGVDHVDIRTPRYMPRRVWSVSRYVREPSALERRSNLFIGADRTRQFWVTVKTPEGATPGTYTGTIDLQVNGAPDSSLDLNLEVLPFSLDPTPTAHGMYYTSTDVENGTNQPLDHGRMSQDVANMADHGMNTLFLSIPPPIETEFVQVGIDFVRAFDLDPIAPIADAHATHGFGPIVFNTTVDEVLDAPIGFAKAAEAVVNGFTVRGAPPPILSAGDESDAAGASAVSTVSAWVNQMNSTVPEARTFTTIVFPENADVFGSLDLDIRAFSSYIDAPVLGPTRPTELWEYSGAAGYGIGPFGDRLYRGIWTRKFDLDGVLQWTYFRPALDPSQPYQDLFPESNRNNMTMWALPGLDGPIPSPGWEAMREGVEDERYIITLQRLIGRALAHEDPLLVDEALAAQAFLNSIFAQIDLSPRADDSVFPISREAGKLNWDYFASFREQAAMHITVLNVPIPEPSTMLLAGGLSVVLVMRRRC
ncbi:MAG: hypothetical protein CMJ18_07035 [Phycisphaeraceae bacterium]|nr:hypothetical protein [Phycisphaeraceae bacterium]